MREKDLLDCAEIIVVGEIGEMNYLNYISSIQLLQKNNTSTLLLPMEKLRELFVTKFPSSQYSEWMKTSR
ncbi:MAG: hypothetical protein KGO49_13485 [Gammaproteobacteria bacterium]|nr:hypothetical protein [Gammaproteobacteria bacterium]